MRQPITIGYMISSLVDWDINAASGVVGSTGRPRALSLSLSQDGIGGTGTRPKTAELNGAFMAATLVLGPPLPSRSKWPLTLVHRGFDDFSAPPCEQSRR